MSVFTLDSLLSDFLAGIQFVLCQESALWNQRILDTKPDATLRDSVSAYINDDTLPQGWAWRLLEQGYSILNEEARLFILQKITEPMIAFTIYVTFSSLTIGEEQFLKGLFSGKIPIAEEDLRCGRIVIRRQQ